MPHPTRLLRRALLGSLVTSAVALAGVPTALAATSDVSITGGYLEFINSTPGDVAFPPVVLNGTDQVTSQTQPLNVNDSRGTGEGWNITATSTVFSDGTNKLPLPATTLATEPPVACDAAVACTPATNTVTYPYTLPADDTAPIATRVYNAELNTGSAAQTITPNWQLSIPSSTRAGNYTSTWTISLVSGP